MKKTSQNQGSPDRKKVYSFPLWQEKSVCFPFLTAYLAIRGLYSSKVFNTPD